MAKWFRRGALLAAALGFGMLLSGCSSYVLFNPKGPVGSHEESLIIIAAILMAIVAIPTMFMAVIFARRYRASNTKATYRPDWSHSNKVELVTWSVPAVIVAILGVFVWIYSHSLDPYRTIASNRAPVEIEVVSLDWKWLFIYPKQNIATINEIEFPAGTPVHFYITSETVMNSFFIPQLGSQIMTMPGMQTQLNLVADHPGTYDGISSQFSGRGFSGMTFKAIATKNEQQFAEWIDKVKSSSKRLDQSEYQQLIKPSEYVPVEYFSSVEPELFHRIIAKYMANSPTTTPATAGS